MLSAADGCELSITTRENRLEEIQEAAASSLFPPPVFQDVAACTALCVRKVMLNAIDKARPPVSATKWWGNDETDLLMSSHKTLSLPALMSYLCCLALRIWTSFWRRGGSTGMDMWNARGAVKTAFDIQVDGKHGPGRPKMTLKQLTERDCREWKLSW